MRVFVPFRLLTVLPALVRCLTFDAFDCDAPTDQIYHLWRFHVPTLPDELLQKPWDDSERLGFWNSRRDSSHFEGERLFPHLLRKHPCHTDDPDRASAFYVPAQTCTAHSLVDWGPHDNATATALYDKYESEIVKHLRRHTRLQTDRDLLLTHHVSAWPFGNDAQWGDSGMSLVGPEVVRNPYGLLVNSAGRWDLAAIRRGYQDIVVPYFDRAGQRDLTEDALAGVNRTHLIVFHGSSHPPKYTRMKMREHFDRHPDRALWEQISRRPTSDDWSGSAVRGIFGAMAKGDSLTSRRLFSLILGGTIPVILDDLLVLPYAAFLDWRQLAVFIPERRLFEDPDFDLITYLDAIPQSEIDRYRRHLRAVRRHFLFHEELIEPGDAVDLFVREMAMSTLKIRSNLDVVRRNVDYGEWSAVRPPVREDEQPPWCGFFGKLCYRWLGL